MATIVEILDFTNVAKRKTRCPHCKGVVTFTMREFFNFTKTCPHCKEKIALELDTSVDIPCENDEWRKQTLGEMLKAVIEKQQKEGRDSEEWGMLESW